MKPYPVRIDPSLIASVQEVVAELNLPVAPVSDPEEAAQGKVSSKFLLQTQTKA